MSAIKGLGGLGKIISLYGKGSFLKVLLAAFPTLRNNLTAFSTAATAATGGFASLRSGAIALAGSLTVLQKAFIAVAVVATVVAIVDALTVSLEESKEKLSNLKSEYNKNKDELASLNSELETTRSRISELESMGSLSFVDQAELNNLRKQNNELKRQIDLLEISQKKKNEELNRSFVDTMKKDMEDSYEFTAGMRNASKNYVPQNHTSRMSGAIGLAYSQMDERDYINAVLLRREELIDKISESGISEKEKTKLDKQVKEIDEYLLKRQEDFAEISSGMFRIDNPTEDYEKEVNNYLDMIDDFNDRVSILWADPSKKSQMQANAFTRLINGQFSETTKGLQNLGKQGKVTAEMLGDEAYDDFIQKLIHLGVITDDSESSLGLVALAFNNLDSVVKSTTESTENRLHSVSKASEGTLSKINEISNAQKLLNSQESGKSVSLSDLTAKGMEDYASALEYVNGVYQLNAEKVNAIIEAKAKEQIEVNNTNKAYAQSEYLKNAKQIEEYRKELSDAEKANDGTADAIRENINNLLNENSALRDECAQYDLMSAALAEATNAYQTWLNATSATQTGDMFDGALSAVKQIDDVLNNTESDLFGRVGRTDYKAAVDFIVPDSVDHDDAAAVSSYLESIDDMFTFDDNGNRTGLDIETFIQKSMDKRLIALNEAGDSYEVAAHKTMEDFASELNLAMPIVRSVFGELEEFGAKFDWADEASKTIGDLAVAAVEARELLRKISGNEKYQMSVDTSDITSVDKASEIASEIRNEISTELSNLENGGSVDLHLRPTIDTAELVNAGWDEVAGNVATVFTSTFSNEAGDVAINFTPIVTDKEGNYVRTLSPDELTEYAEGVISGVRDDDLKLQIGSEFTGEDAIDQATEAANRIHELHQMDADLNVSDDSLILNTKLAYLDKTINDMQKLKGKINIDSSEVEAANNIIMAAVAEKQLLSAPAIMSVDVSKVTSEIAPALDLLQQFQNAQNTLEMNAEVGADTSAAEAEINSIVAQIQGLDSDILAKLKLDPASADSIQTYINGLDAQAIVDFGVDSSLVDAFEEADHSAKGVVNWYDNVENVKKSFSAVGYVNWQNASGPSSGSSTGGSGSSTHTSKSGATHSGVGGHFVNGTANASGSAKIGGDWRAKGGRYLVGELGREIVVDPNTGRWYTVGDNGAEFVDIPDDAIIFNHLQSDALLNNGRVAGRGSANINGTAYVKGRIPINIDGGIGIPGGNKKKKPKKTSPSGNTPSNSPAKDTKEESKETVDWIEIVLDRIGRAIEHLSNIAQSAFKSLGSRMKASQNAIASVNKEIELQQRAHDRYIKEANSVGLSSELTNLVQNGTIDISKYDSDTQKKIKEYQGWYEKALDASDAVSELHEQIAQYRLDTFNDAQDDADNQIKAFDHLISMAESRSDLLKEQGYMDSAIIYESLMQTELEKLQKLQQERADLQKHFDDAMASGEIEEGSEAWYEMKNAIDEVDESIAEANLDLVKYENTIQQLHWEYFDYLQERISKVNDEADFLIDLLGESDLFNENGALNENGLAVAGLHTQKYNTYMAQADAYAKEIRDIDSELANDPNNQTLIERREELLDLQQESILSAEDEKQAIVELTKQGIDAQIASMNELIDKYKETLDSAKDLRDYQKKVNKQSDNIANIEKQLSAYANDTSEETRAKVQKLQVELKSAQDELRETEYQQYVSEQKKMLDDLSSEYEEVLNQRLDDVDALMQETIDAVNANSSVISETISKASEDVGYSLTDSIRKIWNREDLSLDGVVSKYGDDFGDKLTSTNNILGNIYAAVSAMISASDGIAVKKYAKGGLVNYTGLAQLDGTPDKPEIVLSPDHTQEFIDLMGRLEIVSGDKFNYGNTMGSSQVGLTGIVDVSSKIRSMLNRSQTAGNVDVGGIEMDIHIDHVSDYNDFVSKLQKDKTFERMIQAMTADRMMGGNPLAKFKCSWSK